LRRDALMPAAIATTMIAKARIAISGEPLMIEPVMVSIIPTATTYSDCQLRRLFMFSPFPSEKAPNLSTGDRRSPSRASSERLSDAAVV
jgi:hypothetical protein